MRGPIFLVGISTTKICLYHTTAFYIMLVRTTSIVNHFCSFPTDDTNSFLPIPAPVFVFRCFHSLLFSVASISTRTLLLRPHSVFLTLLFSSDPPIVTQQYYDTRISVLARVTPSTVPHCSSSNNDLWFQIFSVFAVSLRSIR